MNEKWYKATYVVDGEETKTTKFYSTSPYDDEAERRRSAKVEIERQEGIIPSRLSDLDVEPM